VVDETRREFGTNPPPVILGGWSTGAEMAVAAGAGPHPPPGVTGLLLFSPGKRSRYGIHLSDQLDITPTGPGTFALSDFGNSLGRFRVVQWHGGVDPFDSTSWLETLRAPHRLLVYPGVWHDFNGLVPGFVGKMLRSIDWLVPPPGPAGAVKTP
jgi:hypothetical protein